MKQILLLSLSAALCLLSACGAQPEAPEPMEFPEAPPELTVTAGEASCTALRGGWSWNYQLEDGSYSGAIADSVHPLEAREITPVLETSEPEAALTFALEPDAVAARRWPEEAWGDADAPGEDVSLDGDTLPLRPGGWLYQVSASWDRMPGFAGDCQHSFFVRSTPE